MSEQEHIPILQGRPPTNEEIEAMNWFSDRKQIEFFNEAGKNIASMIATFLTVLFAVTAFGNNFPPTYIKGNTLAKVLVVATLIFYLGAMGFGLWSIQPRRSKHTRNLSAMEADLSRLVRLKAFRLHWAGYLFVLGSITLAGLIISIILKA
ncbi:MAG TPA: hypothetical protein VIZ18_01355 [Ktedonobacteraceae bacterium]